MTQVIICHWQSLIGCKWSDTLILTGTEFDKCMVFLVFINLYISCDSQMKNMYVKLMNEENWKSHSLSFFSLPPVKSCFCFVSSDLFLNVHFPISDHLNFLSVSSTLSFNCLIKGQRPPLYEYFHFVTKDHKKAQTWNFRIRGVFLLYAF